MTPTDIRTNETLAFVLESLPHKESRILDVGCGDGRLAYELQRHGCDVVAVDSSKDKVHEAKQLNVDARLANYPDFEERPFDVVLFSHSLHHIQPLEPALVRARQLMRHGGRLIVEDFAFNNTSEDTVRWFYRLLKLLEVSNFLLPAADSFGRAMLAGGGDFSIWKNQGDDIASEEEMSRAIQQRFDLVKTNTAPYLYKYVAKMLPENDRGGRIALCVLELETNSGINRNGFLVGRRFVATQKDAA